MIIVLIGYMASGKTSIGKKLAEKLNYNFLDLDDFIEEKENMSVTDVFKEKGEIYFRKQESQYLNRLLKSKNNTILSVGGGTPCYSGNIDVILSAKTTEEMTAFIGKHLFERIQFYNQAEIKVSIDNKTKDDVVEDIILELF